MMPRKGTIKYAQENLTPAQFAAWEAMPVKLSKKQLQAGDLPPMEKPSSCACEPTCATQVEHDKATNDKGGFMSKATKKQIARAREEYEDSDDVKIDDDALVSEGEGATWVQAWVLLPDEEEEG
jgi:hypothetical protein